MVDICWKLKIGSGFGNPWGQFFLAQNNFLCIDYLPENRKVKKNQICLLLVAVGWKLKIGPGFGNPWGPIFFAQNNFLCIDYLPEYRKFLKNQIC